MLAVPSIDHLDITDNCIKDPQILPEILEKLPNLRVLSCKGNKFRDGIKNYRKTLTARLHNLQHLDDAPVTEDDRRRAIAFAEGGLEAERKEIKRQKEERHKEWEDNTRKLTELLDGHRDETEQEK